MCGRVLLKALRDLWSWGRGNRSFFLNGTNLLISGTRFISSTTCPSLSCKTMPVSEIINETQCCIFIFTFVPVHQAVLSTKYSLCQRPRSANTLIENMQHLSELAHKIVHWNSLAFLSLCFLLIWFSRSFLLFFPLA